MSDNGPISGISVHWMPFNPSCTLSFHRGDICEEGVTIRPNVAATEPGPKGWQNELQHLCHGTRLSLEEARAALLTLGLPEWEDTIHATFSVAELRGRTPSLKFWLTCPSPAGIKAPTEEQVQQAKARLFALRAEVWG